MERKNITQLKTKTHDAKSANLKSNHHEEAEATMSHRVLGAGWASSAQGWSRDTYAGKSAAQRCVLKAALGGLLQLRMKI